MKIVIGADHGGFELKQEIAALLVEEGHIVHDVGCHSLDSVDYPDFADRVVSAITSGEFENGILICGTGIGMSIAANRNRKIRAAVCHDEYTAAMSREHNNANILCLGARVLKQEEAKKIVRVWLGSHFTGGRHQLRVSKFSD